MTDKESSQSFEMTADEREGLEQITAGDPPFSQRAQALLALADGADLAAASIATGLTINQVRYWLGRFGTRRLSIFPDELLMDQTPAESNATQPPLLAAPEEAPLLEAPEIAGELPENISASSKVAATAAVAGTTAVAAKKSKKAKKAKPTKKKSKSTKKKAKKAKKEKKSKKNSQGKKSKKKKNKKKTSKKGSKDQKKR